MIDAPGAGNGESLEPTRVSPNTHSTRVYSAERSALLRPTVEFPSGTESARQRLDDLGWKQASILPPEPELIAAIIPDAFSSFQQLPDPPFWCIVVSRDCIVVADSFDVEPGVELVIVTPIDRVRETRRRVRHPRELDFNVVDDHGEVIPVTLHIRARASLDRRLLMKYPPDKSMAVSEHAIGEIVEFLSGRNDREAFPDAFEQRFAKVKRHWAGVLNRYSKQLIDVFVRLTPPSEIGTDEIYLLTVYAIVTDVVDDGPPAELKALKQALKGELRRPLIRHGDGIELEKIEVYGRDDVTLRDFDSMRRLDFGVLTASSEAAAERERAGPRDVQVPPITAAPDAADFPGTEAPPDDGPPNTAA